MRFSDAATVYQSGNIALATPVFVGAAGRYLDLVFDAASAKWVETGRGPTPAVITDYSGATIASVAASTTTYLGANGAQASEQATRWVSCRAYSAVSISIATDAAPGASQSYTYTLMQDGVATAITGTISGSSSYSVTVTAALTVNPNDSLSIKLVTSSGAAATTHRYAIELTN